jgi:two-component system OmpR family response regulator
VAATDPHRSADIRRPLKPAADHSTDGLCLPKIAGERMEEAGEGNRSHGFAIARSYDRFASWCDCDNRSCKSNGSHFMTRILLIDDDFDLVSLLSQYLAQDGFSVGSMRDGVLGVTAALSGQYAIVILDVMMPRLNGLDVLRQIRRESAVPVLMLTARGDDADRITGLELGADDYVTKPCTPRELVARLRAILRRTTLGAAPGRSAGPLNCGALTMWPEQRRAGWMGQPLVLTSTEFRLLELLLRNAGCPVSKDDLSQHALGRSIARHDRSIDVHLSSIRRKLGLLPDGRSRIQAVHRQGYQLLKE